MHLSREPREKNLLFTHRRLDALTATFDELVCGRVERGSDCDVLSAHPMQRRRDLNGDQSVARVTTDFISAASDGNRKALRPLPRTWYMIRGILRRRARRDWLAESVGTTGALSSSPPELLPRFIGRTRTRRGD